MFFFVEKKDGTLRPCINFCGQNDITMKNKYRLKLISSWLAPLHEANLDLWNGYHLICIRDEDEWKMAFNTLLGHFKCEVLSSISNAIWSYLPPLCLFVYSDILIFSNDLGVHSNTYIKVCKSNHACAYFSFASFTLSNPVLLSLLYRLLSFGPCLQSFVWSALSLTPDPRS